MSLNGELSLKRKFLRQARRYLVITIGFLVLGVGLVLAAIPPIPGGLPGVILGLWILSTELRWARRLRDRVTSLCLRFIPKSGRRLLERMFTKLKLGDGPALMFEQPDRQPE